MSSPPSSRLAEDPDLLSRWLGILALITNAQQMNDRGGGAWPALALVSADAAVEALLGMIAMTGMNVPNDRDPFERVYELAREALQAKNKDLPVGLRNRILAYHRQRNIGLHQGGDISPRAAASAVRTARDLQSLVRDMSAVLGLVEAEGPVRAVGEVCGVEAVAEALAAAQDALDAHSAAAALDQAAIALDLTIRRLDPRIKPDSFEPMMRTYGEPDERPHVLKEWMDKRLQAHEDWIIPMALGLSPIEYSKLRATVGTVHWLGMPAQPTVYRGALPDAAACEAAIIAVAEVVFRVWQSGALRQRESWEG